MYLRLINALEVVTTAYTMHVGCLEIRRVYDELGLMVYISNSSIQEVEAGGLQSSKPLWST